MKREVNWRHFADASCASCAHPSKVSAGELCSEHGPQAEAFVQGFEAAARLAVGVAHGWPDGLWRATAPGGWHLAGGAWVKTSRSGFLNKEDAERALTAAPPLVWWPVQPWEVEVSDDAVR